MAIPFEITIKVDNMCMQKVSMYNIFQDDGFGECMNTNFLCTREVTFAAISFIKDGIDTE